MKTKVPCCSNMGLVVFLVFFFIIGLVVYLHKPHNNDTNLEKHNIIQRISNWIDIGPTINEFRNTVRDFDSRQKEGLKNKNDKNKKNGGTQERENKENDDEIESDNDEKMENNKNDKSISKKSLMENHDNKQTRSIKEWDAHKRHRSTFDVNYEPFNAKYMNLYDTITFSNKKFDYETMIIMKYLKKSRIFSSINLLDIGCGSGMHVAYFKNQGYDVVGLDKSTDAIDYCKRIHHRHKEIFRLGDAMRVTEFKENIFSHILCLNNTIYYINNISQFFKNCFQWLKNDGIMFLHLVDDIEQRYYDTNGWIKIKNGIKYKSTYDVQGKRTVFNEKIKDNENNVLMNQHMLYNVGETQIILNIATKKGFIILKKYSLKKSGFRHHYIYVLQK